jgi:hypothetical protein
MSMSTMLALLLVAHGLIHLLGFAKAFQLADLPQLTQLISPFVGSLWLASAVMFLAAAASLVIMPRAWWMIGAGAIGLSVVVILTSWNDAKFGMAVNLVVLVAVFIGFVSQGPVSLRAAYDADVDRGLALSAGEEPVSDIDLAHLPAPVQRYLRASGAVGLPRLRNFHARMHGRIRSGRDARWMQFEAEQYSFIDEPARLFYLNASMYAIPVQGYHRYVGSSATMQVKAAGLLGVVDAGGRR